MKQIHHFRWVLNHPIIGSLKRLPLKIKGTILVILFLLMILLIRCHREDSKEKLSPDSPVKVSVAKVVVKDMPISLELVGSVYPYQSVALKSRIDSQIVKVNFKDGEYVHEGQILFELDNRTILAQLEQQKANLKRDEAELNRAKRQYERDEELKNKKLSSLEKYDASKNAYEAALAIIQATKAQIENLEVQLAYCFIHAPISGRVGTINLTLGNNVKANDTGSLVTINQIKPIKLQIPLPQRYISHLQQAMDKGEVKVKAKDASGKILGEGVVSYKENTLDESTRNLAVRAIFANEDEKLWPGMFVDVELILGIDHKALIVPVEAIQPGLEGSNYLYKIVEGKAQQISVVVKNTIENFTSITGDVKEGDQVVTDGHLRLKDGSSVTISVEQQ